MGGWKVKSLGDVCTLQRGFDLPTPDRRPGAYPLVSSSGIVDMHAEGRVPGPGVVTGRSGSIGSVFYVQEDFWPLNTALYVRDFHDNDPRFVYYLLTAFDLKRYAGGTGVPTLNRNDVHTVPVLVPDRVEEQHRIVAILDEAFEAIATAKSNTEKNLQNAREVFERKLQATFDAEAPTWPVHRLGTLCTQVTDGTHNSPPYVETGVPMLDSKHIGDGFEIDDSQAEKFIAPDVDAQLAQRCKPSEGDILISSRGTIGKIAIVQAGQDFNIMGNMILLRLPSNVDGHFIAFYVLSRVAHIESIARGVAQKGLYLGQVRDYEVPVPSLDDQRRIAKRLRCLQVESARLCEVIKRKLAALDELKKSLLHQAFTGQLTAKTTDKQLEPVA